MRRTAQAGAHARNAVVVRQQRAESLERREGLKLDQLVVGEVHTVELVLRSAGSQTQTPKRAAHSTVQRACVTARFSTLLSLCPAREDGLSGSPRFRIAAARPARCTRQHCGPACHRQASCSVS